MWSAEGKLIENKKVPDYLLVHKIPTVDGQSGSPIFKKEQGRVFVVGVHLGGDKEAELNVGARITDEIRKMMNNWMRGKSGVLDLSNFECYSEG